MATPYYQDDYVTIFLGDSREILPEVGGEVMVTDPPYGRAWRQGNTGKGRGWADDSHPGIQGDSDTGARDAALASWGAKPAIVFGDLMLSPPSKTKIVLIYDKGPGAGFTGAIAGFRRNVEAIYLLGSGWASGLGGASAVLTTYGVTGGNLARIHDHPHTKPEDLMRHLVEASPPGAVVDPFCGSGSTLRAAKDLGRKAIGIEIEECYAEIAAKRCAQEVLF